MATSTSALQRNNAVLLSQSAATTQIALSVISANPEHLMDDVCVAVAAETMTNAAFPRSARLNRVTVVSPVVRLVRIAQVKDRHASTLNV
jgi:hypothetical protein